MLEQFEPGARMLAKASFERPYGRGINFQIQVEDVEDVHAALVNARLSPFLPLEERWYRSDDTEVGVRQFIAQDPDGYLIRLSQPFGTRAVAG